jgi:transporter family protein
MQSWIVLGLLSAVSAAAVAIFGKLGLKGVDSTLATAVRSVVMALFLVIAAAQTGALAGLSALGSGALLYIVLSGLAGALSWFFYFWALKLGPATGVAAMDRLSVVFVLILSVLFLGESLTWKTALGAVLIAAGAFLMVWK